MSRRTRRLIAIAAGLLGGVVPAAGVVARQVPDAPGIDQPSMPFSLQPDRLPGPPRAMGMTPFGQSLPPTDLTLPPTGPPRAMGESPFFPPFQPGPFTPFSPSVTPGGTFFPGLIPGGGGAVPPGVGTEPDTLLLLPGLLGREPAEGGAPPDARPFALPEVPGFAAGTPEIPRGAPRVDDQPPGPPLMLQEVRSSAERRYPLFLAVLEDRNRADGDVISARGSFDLNLNIDSRNWPLGFYDRSLQDVFFEQPIFATGGKVFAGYRLAQGHWPTYYNYLNTRGGGAFVSGLELPLLRNLAIDPKRAKLFQSEIERRKVEPTILKERVSLLKNAAKAYWAWVAAGHAYAIYQDLVEITQAQFRTLAEQARPEIGRVSQVDVIAFQNVLIKRQVQLVDARRDLQQAAIALSFYLRDPRGLPTLPDAPHIPLAFPDAEPLDQSQVEQDIAVALRLRPEVFSLLLEYDKARIERDLAKNLLLPSMNFYVYAEQNVGDRDVDLVKDFRPFILESSIFFEVPLQRRYARGRVRAAEAELRQIAARTQFARDQIQADVLSTAAALRASYEALVYYRNSEIVARQLAEAERQRLEVQATSPLLFFVVRQQQVLDAQVLRVLAEGKFFSALADYRAAVGLDAVTPEVAEVAPPTYLASTDLAPPMPGLPEGALSPDPIPPPPSVLPDMGAAPGAGEGAGAIPPGADAGAPGAGDALAPGLGNPAAPGLGGAIAPDAGDAIAPGAPGLGAPGPGPAPEGAQPALPEALPNP